MRKCDVFRNDSDDNYDLESQAQDRFYIIQDHFLVAASIYCLCTVPVPMQSLLQPTKLNQHLFIIYMQVHNADMSVNLYEHIIVTTLPLLSLL